MHSWRQGVRMNRIFAVVILLASLILYVMGGLSIYYVTFAVVLAGLLLLLRQGSGDAKPAVHPLWGVAVVVLGILACMVIIWDTLANQ